DKANRRAGGAGDAASAVTPDPARLHALRRLALRLRGREHREHLGAVGVELRRPDAGNSGELTEVTRSPRGDLRQCRVVEDDVRRLRIRCCALEAPTLQGRVEGIVRFGLAQFDEARLDAKLAEKAARPSAPRQREVPLRAGDADVEQTPL